jgi:FixJ family two-component response regulator
MGISARTPTLDTCINRTKAQQSLEGIDFQEEGGLSMHCAYRRLDPTGMMPSKAKLPNTPRAEVNAGKDSREFVYLVDDDYVVRETLREFLEKCGFQVWTFSSARQYLDFTRTDMTACLVLDFNLPDIGGLDLLQQISGKFSPPIIFISAQADVPSSVRAMKAGALEFLMKPVDSERLRIAIQTAFVRDKAIRRKRAELEQLKDRYSRLTPRERDVFPLVVGGLLNKQAASLLGISEITLQIHRSQVMRKMEANSLADLVRKAITLRIPEYREQYASNALVI